MTIQLAALVRDYLEDLAAFNASDPAVEDVVWFQRPDSFDKLGPRIIGVPIKTHEDAVAALDWIFQANAGCMIDLSDDDYYGAATQWLLESLREFHLVRRRS
jgi:hypothetical protein